MTANETPEKETERQGMTLAEWRQSKFHDVVLPSGLEVKAKKASVIDLIQGGKIPDTLIGFFELSMKAQRQGKTLEEVQAETAAEFKISDIPTIVEAFNAVFIECVIEPQVGPEPTDDVLGIDELSYADKSVFFEWANEGVMDLRPFRQQ